MATIKKDVLVIQGLLGDDSTPSADGGLDKLLRRERAQVSVQLAATGTVEVTLWSSTPFDAELQSANLSIAATQAANAASRDYQLFYDDGAGGSATAITAELDGTATAVTAAVNNALTVTPNVTIPAGSRVYLNTTHNGAGAAADITAEAELRYQDDA